MTVVHRHSETTSVDEAAEAFAATWTEAGFQLSDHGDDFVYVQDYVGSPRVGAAAQVIGARLRSRSDENETLFIAWTDRGATSYFDGRRDLDADAGILWSGRRPIGATVDHAVIGSILLERTEFEARARLLLAHPDFALPDFVPLPSPEHVEFVRRHRDALQTNHTNEAVLDSPLVERAITDLTISVVLASAGLDHTDDRLILPATIRRAIAYIDDHLDQPITIADIAAASHMSARGLQDAFQRTLGETPMARVRRGRLARAHEDLIVADPSVDSVAAIAQRWGFHHLGRFAQLYRDAFRETPSQTLRR